MKEDFTKNVQVFPQDKSITSSQDMNIKVVYQCADTEIDIKK